MILRRLRGALDHGATDRVADAAARPVDAVRAPDRDRRGDIEGLRAVAVVLVVLFHASLGGVPGGFVGVDVFFVISGFLITGLLLREREANGTISLAAFYARRVRRLLPAALLVLLVTLLASIALLPPLLVPGVATDTAAAALYVSNMGFAAQATDYFAAGGTPSPILHFWSLGVEEQFYLFWPAVVLLVARGANRPARRVGATVLVIAVASFALSWWLTSADAPWAFFSLPARAWELALGGILAVAGTRLRSLPEPVAAGAGWVGLGLIVLAAVALTDATPFPGSAALLPTVGAALVIVGGSRPAAGGPARVLGTAVPRFLGRISYSLYLWHWPLLVLPAAAAGVALPWPERVVLVVVAVVLAAGTQRWVEDPLRRGRLVGTLPGRNLAMAGALAVAVAIVSVGIGDSAAASLPHDQARADSGANERALDALLNRLGGETAGGSPAAGGIASAPATGAPSTDSAASGLSSGPSGSGPVTPSPSEVPARPATKDGPVPGDLQPALGDAKRDYPASYLDGCHTQTEQPPSTAPCLYGDLASSTTIALFGDSHALSWFPAVERLAREEGWRLLSLTMSACSPADMPVWNPNFQRVSTACATWRAGAIDRLVQMHPALILVTGTRGFAAVDASGKLLSGDARTRAWQAGMERTLGRLIPAARRVILMADTPLSLVDPPVCLSQHPTSVLACATPVAQAINATWLGVERNLAEKVGVGFIDPTPWVCPSSPCPVVLGDLLVYRDAGHLTATFAAALANRLSHAVLDELTPSRRPAAPPAPRSAVRERAY
jgi:peptidoglycan/LPS O-acetylase OafA/YrhL